MTSWRNSKARLILISDLETHVLPLHDKETPAEVAWNQVYKLLPAFADVPFAKFEAHLKAHRQQVSKRHENSLAEEMALAHDRQLHPRKTHNHRGEPVFDLSPAKYFLREDVKNKLHTTMSSLKLQESRPEYVDFKRRKFKDRVYQEVRRQKFYHYLELQRAKKFEEKKRRKTDTNCDATKTKKRRVDDAMDES
jgi:hypothetical protein